MRWNKAFESLTVLGALSAILLSIAAVSAAEAIDREAEGSDFGLSDPLASESEGLSIRGTVFHDKNADGIRDEDEPGLPEWTVRLFASDGTEIREVSDESGQYHFSRLQSGNYILIEDLAEGWRLTSPGKFVYEISIDDEGAVGCDFGNIIMDSSDMDSGLPEEAGEDSGAERYYYPEVPIFLFICPNPWPTNMGTLWIVSSSDPNGLNICYTFDWGDNSPYLVTDLMPSGTPFAGRHTYSVEGSHNVRVRATNALGLHSDWVQSSITIANLSPEIPDRPNGLDVWFAGSNAPVWTTATDPYTDAWGGEVHWGEDSFIFTFDFDDGTPLETRQSQYDNKSGRYFGSVSHTWRDAGTYQVRAKAENPALSSGWSDPFTVTILPGMLQVLTGIVLTPTSARLSGEIIKTGDEDPTIHIYWGDNDGGTDPDAWDHDENIGRRGSGIFYKDVTTLKPATRYYYRCSAERSTDTVWSSNTVAFDTSDLISLRSYNYIDRYVRHAGFLGEVTKVVTDLDNQDATFRIGPGLADSRGVSFESLNYPGYYLRHQGFRLKLHEATSDQLFKEDATFVMVPGLANPGAVSFESYNFPEYYIRHSGFHLYVHRGDGELFRQDATFLIDSPKYSPLSVPTQIENDQKLVISEATPPASYPSEVRD